MIRYTRVDGLKAAASSALPSIEITEDGQKIGSIPSWNTLLTPSHIKEGLPRNRVIANQYLPGVFPDPLVTGAFPNGALSFNRNVPNRYFGQTNINKNAWTFFVVLHLRSLGTGGIDLLRGSLGDQTAGARSPRIALSVDGSSFVIYGGVADSTSITRINDANLLGRTALLMATFSGEAGSKLFINGVMGDENANDAGFDELDRAGEYTWLSGFNDDANADVGHCGLFDIDLSKSENYGYRKTLERFLMNKYGIN